MILEFDGGSIKVIPGLSKSSITIRQDSSVVIETDGSITISADFFAAEAKPDVSRYSDPAYLKTLGPITAQGIVTTGYAQQVASPGILMNGIAREALVSALDSAIDKVVTPKQTRIYDGDELVAVSGGLEKVGSQEVKNNNPINSDNWYAEFQAMADKHEALKEYANKITIWQDDPVARLYKGTLKAKTPEEKEVELQAKLDELYSKAKLSKEVEDVFENCFEYLDLVGDAVALCGMFEPEDVGPMSSYLMALVEEHRRSQEAEREADVERNIAEADQMIARGAEFIELLDRMAADPDNEALREELDAFHRDTFGAKEEEPELECSGNYEHYRVASAEPLPNPFIVTEEQLAKEVADETAGKTFKFNGALPPDASYIGKTAEELARRVAPEEKASDCNINFDEAMKAVREMFHRNGEVETPEVPFEGADVTEESVRAAIDALGLKDGVVEMAEGALENKHVQSALDALGSGHFAKFNDPVHGYRGFWEGIDTLVDRGVKTLNGYVERSKK